MANPILKAATVDNVTGYDIDFTANGVMGILKLSNKSQATSIFIAFDALPAAVTGDGQFELQPGREMSFAGVRVLRVGCITPAGTAPLEVSGQQA